MLNWHFSALRVSPRSFNLTMTFSNRKSCSFWSLPCTMMSSEMFSCPSIPASAVWISYWYCSEAELTPNNSLLYLNRPQWVANVVFSRDSGESSSWWYPHLRSSLENTLLPLMLWLISSKVGIGCLPLRIASLALRMSMQRRMSPPDFGTTTIALTHGVGPYAGSVRSSSMSSSIFSSNFDLMLNGVLRIGYATGFTLGSMWSCTARSFNFPTPLKTSAYLCCRETLGLRLLHRCLSLSSVCLD